MGLLKMILVTFLAVNALFWGLFDHAAHCKVAAKLGVVKCPPHALHIITGLVFFVLAVFTAQWSYIFHA